MKKYLFLVIFLTGCMVGPNYKRPEVAMPEGFLESKKTEAISSIRSWWKSFNDPVLDRLIDQAIESNYDLAIAIEKIEETRAYYRIRRADLFPEVDASAAAFRTGLSQNSLMTSFVPLSAFNTFQAGFDAVWEIDIFGKLRREKEAAWYEVQEMQENMRDTFVTVTSEVARNYADICSAAGFISLTKEKINTRRAILQLNRDRNDTGLESRIEIEEQIAMLKIDEEDLLFYETFYKQTIYRLAALLGKQPESVNEWFKEPARVLKAAGKVAVGLPSELLRRRPDVRAAERNLARATAKIGAAIAEYFPSFSLTGGTGLEANKMHSLFSGGSFDWSVGGLMKWPLITFGRVRANVDVKKSVQKQALLSYENAVVLALKDVEGAMVAYYNQQDKLKQVEEEEIAIRRKVRLLESKYQSGLSGLEAYLAQKYELLTQQVKTVETERTLALDLIALYKALGGGDWPST